MSSKLCRFAEKKKPHRYTVYLYCTILSEITVNIKPESSQPGAMDGVPSVPTFGNFCVYVLVKTAIFSATYIFKYTVKLIKILAETLRYTSCSKLVLILNHCKITNMYILLAGQNKN